MFTMLVKVARVVMCAGQHVMAFYHTHEQGTTDV